MSGSLNGWHDGHADPLRRVRYDPSVVIEAARSGGRRRGEPVAGLDPRPGTSGRRFVIVSVVAVLVFWAVLYVFFDDWRGRYRVRAAYGSDRVAPEVDAFAEQSPPGVEAARWRDAVARTRAMLVTVTRANVLDMEDLRDLRDELHAAAALARSEPSKAVAELAGIWDEMSERGEFLLRDTRTGDAERHPRPTILPSYGEDRVAPALDPLSSMSPVGVDADRWREAIARTRALLLDVTASRRLSTLRMVRLRADLDRAVARARANPASAVRELAGIWDFLHRSGRVLSPDRESAILRHARPALLGP